MNTSPLRPLHEAAGARLLPEPPTGSGELITYGDVPAEYAAGATEGALLLDRTTRGLLAITGADTVDFLHRILANDIKALPPGTGNRNLLLTGKGKVVQLFDLAYLGEGFLLSTAPGMAPALQEALDMYLFTEDVTITDETEAHAPIEIVGPRASAILSAVLDAPDGEMETLLAGNDDGPRPDHTFAIALFAGNVTKLTPMRVAGRDGWRIEPDPQIVGELWTALVEAGATPGGVVAFDSLRAESVAAEVGRDVSDEIYPQEARLEDAFSLTKGCYIGQEVVAKIDTYGGLNKRLFRLRVSHDDPVPPGTRILRDVDGDVRDLGVVTTWAYSFAEDGGVVLGYIKRKHQEPGTEFVLGGTGATATLSE